jgi:hypothetical protein
VLAAYEKIEAIFLLDFRDCSILGIWVILSFYSDISEATLMGEI